jgi:hypothetical protein
MTSFLLDGSERLGQFRRGSFLAEARSLALAFCYTRLTGAPDCRIAVYWNSCVFSCLYFSLPLLPVEFSHRQPWDRKRTFTIRNGKMAIGNDDKKAFGPITLARFSLSTCSVSILLSEFNCVLCWRVPVYSAVSLFRLNVRWQKEVDWCALTLWVRIGGLGFGIQFEETFWLRRSIWDLDMKRNCSVYLHLRVWGCRVFECLIWLPQIYGEGKCLWSIEAVEMLQQTHNLSHENDVNWEIITSCPLLQPSS